MALLFDFDTHLHGRDKFLGLDKIVPMAGFAPARTRVTGVSIGFQTRRVCLLHHTGHDNEKEKAETPAQNQGGLGLFYCISVGGVLK